jgi:hypothetical protein
MRKRENFLREAEKQFFSENSQDKLKAKHFALRKLRRKNKSILISQLSMDRNCVFIKCGRAENSLHVYVIRNLLD